jgi:hypothetical protein
MHAKHAGGTGLKDLSWLEIGCRFAVLKCEWGRVSAMSAIALRQLPQDDGPAVSPAA